MLSDVYFPRVNGVSTSIRTFAQSLARMGHSVTVVAPDYGPGSGQEQHDSDEFELVRLASRVIFFDPEDRLIRAPETLFDSRDAGLDAFGWNFPNVKLLDAFETVRATLGGLETREVALAGIERVGDVWQLRLADGSLAEAPLIVGSDGKKSLVRVATDFRAREHGFTQAALVCDLELGRPLGGASVEFHYDQGPFTLVPAGDREPTWSGLTIARS